MNRIWYASYGSNLSYQRRFMCYIAGGLAHGSQTQNPGCRDKTLPLEARAISLDFELYFAGHSSGWGGSVAFVRKRQLPSTTHGRMYLVTDEQFNDIVLQENGRPVDGSRIVPPFEELAEGRQFTLPGNPLYGALTRIEVQSEHPAWTFTTHRDLPIGPPSEAYLKIIAAGIKETYPQMTSQQICEYLAQAEGVKGRISADQLAAWVLDAA